MIRGAIIVLSFSGCVSLPPQQAARLTEARDIANRTSKLYGVPRVRVFSEDRLSPSAAAGYAPGNNWILIRRRVLGSPGFIPVLAHELGHVTLRHDLPIVLEGGERQPDLAAYRRAAEQRELDANGRAVEIMIRVLGMTERDAVMALASYLAAANTARDGRAIALPHGHIHPCDQLQDLVRRFPGDWSRNVNCDRAPGGLPLLPDRGTDTDLKLTR